MIWTLLLLQASWVQISAAMRPILSSLLLARKGLSSSKRTIGFDSLLPLMPTSNWSKKERRQQKGFVPLLDMARASLLNTCMGQRRWLAQKVDAHCFQRQKETATSFCLSLYYQESLALLERNDGPGWVGKMMHHDAERTTRLTLTLELPPRFWSPSRTKCWRLNPLLVLRFWNSFHISLQFEDAADCLQDHYAKFNFLFSFDHSQGRAHNKRTRQVLRAMPMSRTFGGAQAIMKDITICFTAWTKRGTRTQSTDRTEQAWW